MNEIVQNIKFHKSRLNWDADISLMGEGESKYFLNTVPEDSEHAGVKTNCLGTTQTTAFLSNYYDEWIVTTTSPSDTTKRFDFTLDVVPQMLEIEIVLDGELKHLYISASGYTTLSAFYARLIVEVRKYFEDDLADYGTSSGSIYFTFNTSVPSQTTMQVRKRLLITYPTTLKVIGSFYDGLTDHTYYWLYDSTGTRFLIEYVNYNDVCILLPLVHTISENSLVVNPFIVGTGKKRMLYWCYKGHGTYKINIYDHIVYYTTGTQYAHQLSLIKEGMYGFTEGLSITATSSTTTKNSDLYFQVRSRIRYLDGERSVFSPIYPLAYPASYAENSVGVRALASNMSYSVLTYYGAPASIDKIEYAVKTSNGNWGLTELPISSSSSINELVTLVGNEPANEIAPSEINRLYDYIPTRHGTQCMVNNNRLLLADCTEGFDNVDVTANISYTKATAFSSAPTLYRTITSTYSAPYYLFAVSPLTVSSTEWRSHCLYVGYAGREYFGYVRDDRGLTQANLTILLQDAINYELEHTNGGVDYGVFKIIAGSISANAFNIFANFTGVTVRYLVFRSYVKTRTIKQGTTPYFGLVYRDSYGRCGGVNPITPSAFNRSGTYDYPATASIEITNTPPNWAHSCQLYYGGTNLLSYTQAVIKRADVLIEKDTAKVFIYNYAIDSQLINPASRMSTYVFNPGDKFVFLGYKTDATLTLSGQTFTYTSFPYFAPIIVCDILSQDETGITVSQPAEGFLMEQLRNCTYMLVEIQTPRRDVPIEYFETPYDDGASESSSGGYPTFTVSMDHVINQTFYIDDGVPVSSWIESESFSNYFESKTLGLGRANFYNPGFKQLRRNIIRASNEYIPNTNINGLSTFEWDKEVRVDEQYGFITDMKMVGAALKIIQPRKISSMYIGTEVGVDANGNQVMFRSDKILTEPRYGASDFGSIHPESIVPHGSYLYGYDVVNSAVWRDTPGGTFAISDNAMRSYFKYKTRQLVASCGYSFKAVGGYDYLNEMYLLTFKDPYNSANDETIGFHEPTESWYSFYSFTPEMYCGIPGDYLLSFNAGYLNTHNSATRNNFYSTQYNSDAWVVGNIYPDDTKKYNSLVVNSNDPWYAPEILVDEDSIAHQDTENYTTHKGKMQSLLNENHFRFVNGEFRAEFLRDLLTSDPDTVTPTDAINGRALTGKTILIKLRNSNTSAVHLRGVRLNAQAAR